MFLTIRETLQKDISHFETILSKYKVQLNEQVVKVKEEVDLEVNEMYKVVNKVETDSNTTRALVKGQNEQFSQINYQIEINKYNVERLREKVEGLNFMEELAKTEAYIQKYLPYKVQNMIDDTLFNVLELEELTKLVQYEEKIFNFLDTNRLTMQGKLQREEFEKPEKNLRILLLQKLQADRVQQLNTSTKSQNYNHSTSKRSLIDPNNQGLNNDLAPLMTSQETINSQLSKAQISLNNEITIQNPDSQTNQTILKQNFSPPNQLTQDLQTLSFHMKQGIDIQIDPLYDYSSSQKYQPLHLGTSNIVLDDKLDQFSASNYKNITIQETDNSKHNDRLSTSNKKHSSNDRRNSYFRYYSKFEADALKQIEQGIDVSKQFRPQNEQKIYHIQYKHEHKSSSNQASTINSPNQTKGRFFSIKKEVGEHSHRGSSVPKYNQEMGSSRGQINKNVSQDNANSLLPKLGNGEEGLERIESSKGIEEYSKQSRMSNYYVPKQNTDEFNKEQEELDNELLDGPNDISIQEKNQSKQDEIKNQKGNSTIISYKQQYPSTNARTTAQSKNPPLPQFQQQKPQSNISKANINFNVNPSTLDRQSIKSIQEQRYIEAKKSMKMQIEKQQALKKQLQEIKGGRLSQKDIESEYQKKISNKLSLQGTALEDLMATVTEEQLNSLDHNKTTDKKLNEIKRTIRENKTDTDQSFGFEKQLQEQREKIQASVLSQIEPNSLRELIKDLQNQFNDFRDEFKGFQSYIISTQENIQRENDQIFALTTTQIKEDIQKLNEAFEEIKGDFLEDKKRRLREKTELTTEFRNMSEKFVEGKIDAQQVLEQNDSIVQIINALVSSYKIGQALDLQDEIDRESIFLLGAKESQSSPNKQFSDTQADKFPNLQSPTLNKKKHQVLSLDKNCITCSQGGIPTALNAFKIACLTYTPSQVQYQNQLFTRKELIQKKGDILNLCQQQISDPNPESLEQGVRSILYQKKGGAAGDFISHKKTNTNIGFQSTRYQSKQSSIPVKKQRKYSQRKSPQAQFNRSIYLPNASLNQSKEDLLPKQYSVEFDQKSSNLANHNDLNNSQYVIKNKGEELKKAILAQQNFQINPQMYMSHQGSFKTSTNFFTPQKNAPKRNLKEMSQESSLGRDTHALLPTLQQKQS